jgi:FdhE protein
MTFTPSRDAAAVEQAVARAAAARPAYRSMLGFYGPVFVAQVRAAAHTFPPAIELDDSESAMKLREGFSLIIPAGFTVDIQSAEKLLIDICRAAAASEEEMAGAGRVLVRALGEGMPADDLFDDVLKGNGRIRGLADSMGVAPEIVSLLGYLAIQPSIEACARQLALYLKSEENRGSCPICGSAPILGELDADGKQWLHCRLCWHRWPTHRMACPHCGNRDADSLEYFFSDEEAEYRVNLCGRCRHYLKVVDVRRMDRYFFPPLEQVISLHLDMMAEAKGGTLSRQLPEISA